MFYFYTSSTDNSSQLQAQKAHLAEESKKVVLLHITYLHWPITLHIHCKLKRTVPYHVAGAVHEKTAGLYTYTCAF